MDANNAVSRLEPAQSNQSVPALAPVTQYRLEAPPFEGRLQQDAFARPPQVGDDALALFAHLVRDLVPMKVASSAPPVGGDPTLSSPLG
jgi:hypothetical protein